MSVIRLLKNKAPNARKTKTVKALGPVDIELAREKILAIPEAVWMEEDAIKPNKFSPFKHTQHIIFRFIDSFQSHESWIDNPIWQQWEVYIKPILEQVKGYYPYETGAFPRIMLARLKAGAGIKAHTDASPAARFPHKIHVPLQTNDQTFFYLGRKAYHFETGMAYEVNNNRRHAVVNEGSTDRIHLIFEYYPIDA